MFGAYRVLRGGSWFHSGAFCRSAYRNGVAPGYRHDTIGFRLAMVPSGGR
jgi:formylglycine-generating enzyme required for sulfatase activity